MADQTTVLAPAYPSPRELQQAESVYRLMLVMMSGEGHTRAEIVRAIAMKVREEWNV